MFSMCGKALLVRRGHERGDDDHGACEPEDDFGVVQHAILAVK